jgi:hypothetical protein
MPQRLMTVPKASVEEDHGPVFRQDKVRTSRQRFVLRTLDDETIAMAVKNRPRTARSTRASCHARGSSTSPRIASRLSRYPPRDQPRGDFLKWKIKLPQIPIENSGNRVDSQCGNSPTGGTRAPRWHPGHRPALGRRRPGRACRSLPQGLARSPLQPLLDPNRRGGRRENVGSRASAGS